MLSGNRTHKTPAAQIAANVALGQFLKACSITLRFTDKLALRRSGSLLAHGTCVRCAVKRCTRDFLLGTPPGPGTAHIVQFGSI
jgi:hypothetical protein